MVRRRFPRPVYESLPWAYIVGGSGALLLSYLLAIHAALSLLIGTAGLALLLVGIVVLLRRRDYRRLRAQYGNPGPLGGDET